MNRFLSCRRATLSRFNIPALDYVDRAAGPLRAAPACKDTRPEHDDVTSRWPDEAPATGSL